MEVAAEFNQKKFTKDLRAIMRQLAGKGKYQIWPLNQGEAFSLDIKVDGKVQVIDVYRWEDIAAGKHTLDTLKATVEDALNGIFPDPWS